MAVFIGRETIKYSITQRPKWKPKSMNYYIGFERAHKNNLSLLSRAIPFNINTSAFI